MKKLCKKYETCLTKNEMKVILNEDWEDGKFYVLPKIEKCTEIIDEIKAKNSAYIHMKMPESLTGHPIVGGTKPVTQGASKLLEKILTPLVQTQTSYIKDEWDFFGKFPRKIDPKYTIVTCDIKSLYTSIPVDLGLQAIEYWIDRSSHLIPKRFTKEFIMELLSYVLKNNYFKFDIWLFLQLIGTVMGATFAPPYACLTIGYLEETKLFPIILPQHLSPIYCKHFEENLFRYIDDGYITWPASLDKSILGTLLNDLHPSIKFEIDHSKKKTLDDGTEVKTLNFLDVNIILHPSGKIETDIYYKPTNNHFYLDFNSHHPNHTKSNIPYNLAKRIHLQPCNTRIPS